MAAMDIDTIHRAHHRREANIIWRELKLRLCPTNQHGGPADAR